MEVYTTLYSIVLALAYIRARYGLRRTVGSTPKGYDNGAR